MVKRLLILDNDTDLLEVMQEVFVYEGFDVTTIPSTEDILTEINTHKPDVVMLDYILGGMTGGDICHEIKSNETTRDLPVIIVSAYPLASGSLGSFGCDGFIAKPFDITDLIEQVNTLLAKAI